MIYRIITVTQKYLKPFNCVTRMSSDLFKNFNYKMRIYKLYTFNVYV